MASKYPLVLNGTTNTIEELQEGDTLTGFDSLPSQTNQSGKYLTTDGTTASWATVSGAGGSGDLDGGFSNSIFLISQSVDGGSASG